MGRRTELAAPGSADEFGDDAAFLDTGETGVEALDTDGETVVLDAEQVQDGGVEVADVDRVLDDVVREFIGLAVDHAAAGTASGHPHGEAAGMMIAPVVVAGKPALGVDGAAEFTAPDDEGVLEQTVAFEILDQAVGGLIDIATLGRHATADIGVVIPVVVVDLDEADAALDEATGEQG